MGMIPSEPVSKSAAVKVGSIGRTFGRALVGNLSPAYTPLAREQEGGEDSVILQRKEGYTMTWLLTRIL